MDIIKLVAARVILRISSECVELG